MIDLLLALIHLFLSFTSQLIEFLESMVNINSMDNYHLSNFKELGNLNIPKGIELNSNILKLVSEGYQTFGCLTNPNDLVRIANQADMQDKVEKLTKIHKVSSVPFESEMNQWLAIQHSDKTRQNYLSTMNKWLRFLTARGISTYLLATKSDATAWISSMMREGLSSGAIANGKWNMSSFYTYLRTTYPFIENIFYGVRLPKRSNVKPTHLPSDEDITVILNSITDPKFRAVITLMATYGYRIGFGKDAIFTEDNRLIFTSKGKEYTRSITDEERNLLLQSEFKPGIPFNCGGNTFSQRFIRLTDKLNKEGKLPFKYHAHELRHYYAVKTYKTTKDIHLTCALLGHSSVTITERYLRARKIIL